MENSLLDSILADAPATVSRKPAAPAVEAPAAEKAKPSRFGRKPRAVRPAKVVAPADSQVFEAALSGETLPIAPAAEPVVEAPAPVVEAPKSKLVKSREMWLMNAVKLLRPVLSSVGLALPEKVRVSCGFPTVSREQQVRGFRAFGQSFPASASKDGTVEVFISPVLDQAVKLNESGVLDTLAWVLAKVSENYDVDKSHRALRLQKVSGRVVSTPEFVEALAQVIEKLGAYPHAALEIEEVAKEAAKRYAKATTPEELAEASDDMISVDFLPVKRQVGRLVRVSCQDASCKAHGYVIRVTRSWLSRFGAPLCPGCCVNMTEG